MKKLYSAILIITLTITVALFISCDEQKAKDDITKAFTKIADEAVAEVDKATPKPATTQGSVQGSTGDTPAPTLTKPVLSNERAPWGTVITFPKAARHTYALKEAKTRVALSETEDNRMQVTATQSAQNVIIVATFDGTTSESNPIEFTRKQGNTLNFADATMIASPGDTLIQTASKVGAGAENNREETYRVILWGKVLPLTAVAGKL